PRQVVPLGSPDEGRRDKRFVVEAEVAPESRRDSDWRGRPAKRLLLRAGDLLRSHAAIPRRPGAARLVARESCHSARTLRRRWGSFSLPRDRLPVPQKPPRPTRKRSRGPAKLACPVGLGRSLFDSPHAPTRNRVAPSCIADIGRVHTSIRGFLVPNARQILVASRYPRQSRSGQGRYGSHRKRATTRRAEPRQLVLRVRRNPKREESSSVTVPI